MLSGLLARDECQSIRLEYRKVMPYRRAAKAEQIGELRLGKRALSEQSKYFSPHRVVKEACIADVSDTSDGEPFHFDQCTGLSHNDDSSSRLDLSFYLKANIPFYSILVQYTRAVH